MKLKSIVVIIFLASFIGVSFIRAEEIKTEKTYPEAGLVQKGIEYGKKGMYDEALKELDEAVKLNPMSFTAYHYRATVWAYKGDLDKAIADWDKSIEIDNKQYLSHFSRGMARYMKGDIDKAIEDWNESILLNPKYVDSYFQRASAFYNKKDYANAIADFSKLIEIDPDRSAKYHFSRAVIYSVEKDYDKSWEDMHEIEKLGQTSAPEYKEFLKVLKKESGRDK